MRPKYSFVFVCHKGKILPASLLLAISLAARNGQHHEIIAVIPTFHNDEVTPSEVVTAFLRKLGVKVCYIENSYIQAKNSYELYDLYSNKIYALGAPARGDKVVFLDSDIICLKALEGIDETEELSVLARIAGKSNVSLGEWEKLYKLVGLRMPPIRIPCLFDKVLLPPYFNSGVIIIRREYAQEFKEKWLDSFSKVSTSGILGKHNILMSEQSAMSLTIQLMDYTYGILDPKYNFLSARNQIENDKIPYFAHYHTPDKIIRDPILLKHFQEYLKEYPILRSVIKANSSWNAIFGSAPNHWNSRTKGFLEKLLRK